MTYELALELAAEKAAEKAEEKGEEKGRLHQLFDLVNNGIISAQTAVEEGKITEAEFLEKFEEYNQSK